MQILRPIPNLLWKELRGQGSEVCVQQCDFWSTLNFESLCITETACICPWSIYSEMLPSVVDWNIFGCRHTGLGNFDSLYNNIKKPPISVDVRTLGSQLVALFGEVVQSYWGGISLVWTWRCHSFALLQVYFSASFCCWGSDLNLFL